MKRFFPIVLLGVVLSAAAFSATYFSATKNVRCMADSKSPELAWLKSEFSLGDAEFQRISILHEAYLPECGAMCKKISAKNEEIRELLSKSGGVTPEIAQKMAEAGGLRVECQKNMLNHFLAVSRAMPPEQGKRYLEWVEQAAFNSMDDMTAAKCPACRK